MADLSKIVEYERGFPVKLVYPAGHPQAGEEIGITWWITHQDSPAVKKVVGRHINIDRTRSALRMTGDGEDIPDEMYLDRESEKLAASVCKWEWGDNTFEGEKMGDVTYEAALKCLNAAPWIFTQVFGAHINLGNFT
jgi:hypothetical protein